MTPRDRSSAPPSSLRRLEHWLTIMDRLRVYRWWIPCAGRKIRFSPARHVFQDGEPNKSEYRRYRIRTVEGQDDFAMMQEVIQRRVRDAMEGGTPLADLIIVDGGKGQLSSAVEILKAFNLEDQPIIGLAKKQEQIFLPGQSDPVVLDNHSPILHLLQRIRDEAHRFAITYHRKLREKALTTSILDYIPSIRT